jgi:hypothetical protein
MKRNKCLLLSTILTTLIFISAIKAQTTDNSEKQGAFNMPYVRYDSKDAKFGGKAKRLKAKNFDYRKTASEASNQEYIALKNTKDYISWRVREIANGVTIRFTLPDNEKGESVGQKSDIDVYINDKHIRTIALDSRWAWQYFKLNESNPLLDITDMPLMRFDEVHFLLSKPIVPGDVISIRKTNNDHLDCGIDFIEIENVPSAIPQPEGTLSVKDFGAKGDGKTNDLPAFNACIKAALKINKSVYIPEGTYALNSLFTLFEDNINIQGAGMWYTNLFFTNNGIMKGGICGNANNLRIADLHINGINTIRQERNGDYRDYKGIWGNFGENSVIENVWIEHFEAGIWIAGYYEPIKAPTQKLRVSNVRLRNHYADGVNFAEGTSHSIFEYSDVRNCGDDGIASWSQTHRNKQCNQNNIFRYCTIEFGWRAGGIGMFGGGGHQIYNCYVGEHLMSAGIRFTADFPGCSLDPNNPMKVFNCTVYKCGTTKDLFSNRLGAIDIHGSTRYNLDNIQFENITVIKSQSDGIQLWGGHMNNLSFKNIKIIGGGKGFKVNKKKKKNYAIVTYDKGSAKFSNTTFKKYIFNKKNKNNQFSLTFNP